MALECEKIKLERERLALENERKRAERAAKAEEERRADERHALRVRIFYGIFVAACFIAWAIWDLILLAKYY